MPPKTALFQMRFSILTLLFKSATVTSWLSSLRLKIGFDYCAMRGAVVYLKKLV